MDNLITPPLHGYCNTICRIGERKYQEIEWYFATTFDHMGVVPLLMPERRDRSRRSGINNDNMPDLTCGTAEPFFESRLAELRVIAGEECALAQLHAVVARVRVGDNLARILACG